MEIRENDLIIISDNIEVPPDFPYKYHKMRYLHAPSIVSSSYRGSMNTNVMSPKYARTGNYILGLLGLNKKIPVVEKVEREDIFLRHIRILNKDTNEYYHNKGATVLVNLMADEGRFIFSYAICNHKDSFNKLIAHNVCKERMEKGEVVECINYDPSISILQNIYIAISVQQGRYSWTDVDWNDILPELYGTYNNEQRESLGSLRKLIRGKAAG